MEAEEIYNLTISPLVVSRFAIQWSQDNHISVLTERGIHIFELIPSPMSPHSTIRFSRSFIYVPPVFPTEVITSKLESKIWSMDRDEVYSFMMDECLTPKMSNIKEMVPRIIDVVWSPQNLIHPSKCLLAILTSTGATVVAHKISTDWYPTYDLCSVRYNAVEEKINTKLKDSKSNPASFLTLKHCVKTLQASSMTWSELFVDFAYLVVAYFNGDVIIYKLPRILDCNEISKPTIVSTIELNEYIKITTLHWITVGIKEYIIIIGYFDGRIYGLKIEERDQVFEIKSVDKYYDYKDRISVSAARTFPQNGSNIKVLISKGSFLFLARFTTKGMLKSIQHLQLEGFTISGLICIGADHALITAENNSMFVIDTQDNRFVEVKIKSGLPLAHLRYLGLAHSSSYAIFVLITSPNIVYDHLVMKEPSKMCMFSLKSDNWDPLVILQRSKGRRFGELWDCLEVIRMKATKAAEPATVLPKIPSNLEFLSLHELQIAMWVSVILEICEKKKVIQGIGSIAGEISEAQPLIFIHTVCNYLEHLSEKSSLSEEEKLSINLLQMYLEVYLAGEENEEASPLSKHVKDILKKISQFCSKSIESCNLCGEAINDLPWKVTKCPQGHILPRCAITLLQITTMEYGTCPICGLIFHQCLNQEFKETKCLFCDVPAPQESRVLCFKLCVSAEKSLSRQRNYMPATLEDREMDVTVDES